MHFHFRSFAVTLPPNPKVRYLLQSRTRKACSMVILWYICNNVLPKKSFSGVRCSITSALVRCHPWTSVSEMTRSILVSSSLSVCVSISHSVVHRRCKAFVLRLGPASIQEFRLCCSCGTFRVVLLAIFMSEPGKCKANGRRTPRRCFLPSELPNPCLSTLSPYIVISSS